MATRKSLETVNGLTEEQIALDRTQRANEQVLSNAMHRNIAANLIQTPTLPNLARAAYHYYKGNKFLGGEDEMGGRYLTGVAPTPSIGKKLATRNIYKQLRNRDNDINLESATEIVNDYIKKNNIPILNGSNGSRYIKTAEGKLKSIQSLIQEELNGMYKASSSDLRFQRYLMRNDPNFKW